MKNLDTIEEKDKLTPKDYVSDQAIRWCPGCGDYSILKQMQSVLAELQIPPHQIVIVSGIGCSSRFPYYMNTYGLHTIHGRSLTFASGLKFSRPELKVWCITGDGDCLSIGAGHTAHALRRNFDINILLFNNQIYGLTKGQYSPTSEKHKITKSSPLGSIDTPLHPLSFALGSEGTFIARSLDVDAKHLKSTLLEGEKHKGTSFIEIYQNCNIYNDRTFKIFTDKANKAFTTLFLECGKPLTYGPNHEFGIRLDGLQPEIVALNTSDVSTSDLWIHDSSDFIKATILSRFFSLPKTVDEVLNKKVFPRPFGVIYQKQTPCYEDVYLQNIKQWKKHSELNLDKILSGEETWNVLK